MKTKQFTGSSKVWISSTWKTFEELNAIISQGENDEAWDYLSMSNCDMSNSGWVEVGTATVTVTLHDTDAVVGKQVAALKQELQNVRAAAQMQENAILDRISKLQAITYTAEA